jgi:nucleolar protein 12
LYLFTTKADNTSNWYLKVVMATFQSMKGSIFGSPAKGKSAETGLSSIFSDASKAKFARVAKPVEMPKKRAEVTEKLDEEEKQVIDEKSLRAAAKKAKRTIKPRKGEKDGGKVVVSAVLSNKSTLTPPAPIAEEDDFISNGDDKNSRTIFLGNVPITEDVKSITKFCSEYGEVESVRLRSVPVAGTAVDESGNQNLVKKICVNTKKFGAQKGSLNAYVVFKKKESLAKALKANNRLIGGEKDKGGRHLRVDLMKPTLFPPARSVFIGALPHYADEEEVRNHFAKVLANGQDDIENIRLVRDAETMVGKGIGYILFANKDAVFKALTLHGKKYHKRWELRVTVCGKRTKRSNNDNVSTTEDGDEKPKSKGDKRKREPSANEKAANKRISKSREEAKDAAANSGDKPRWRDMSPEALTKRKEELEEINNKQNSANALLKRANKDVLAKRKALKTTNTRKRVLEQKGQVKKDGRKGKRLGGNVKKAMKAQKGKL